MSASYTITRSIKDQSATTLGGVEAVVTGDKENNIIAKSIAAGANTNILWKCTRAKLKLVAIKVSTAASIFTNDLSTGTPQDTIVLTASQTFIWSLPVDTLTAGPIDCPFSGDVTTLYVTNAGTCILDIRCLELAT